MEHMGSVIFDERINLKIGKLWLAAINSLAPYNMLLIVILNSRPVNSECTNLKSFICVVELAGHNMIWLTSMAGNKFDLKFRFPLKSSDLNGFDIFFINTVLT